MACCELIVMDDNEAEGMVTAGDGNCYRFYDTKGMAVTVPGWHKVKKQYAYIFVFSPVNVKLCQGALIAGLSGM